MPNRQDGRAVDAAAPGPSEADPIGIARPSKTYRLPSREASRDRSATSTPSLGSAESRVLGLGPVLAAAVAVGVAAGFMELAVFAIQVHGLGRVGLKTLTISRHVGWMVPVAEALLVFGLSFVLVAPTLLVRGGEVSRRTIDWAGAVLGSLLVLGPLLAIRGLHPIAALVLAIPIGTRLRRWLVRPTPRWRRACLVGGGMAFGLLVAFSTWQWARVERSGDRAWSRASVDGPNLLWIVMDTVRADRMSLYGYSRPTTPSIDRWARQGITFDAAYSGAPWTLPSHLTMFTGLWPFQHKARVDRPFSGPAPTLAEHLAGRGYTTAGIVANNRMCNDVFGVGRGFDTYVDVPSKLEVSLSATLLNSALGSHLLRLARQLGLPVQDELTLPERHHAPEIIARGRGWLDHVRRRNLEDPAGSDRPFFLFLNFMDAHGPYLPAPHVERAFWTDPLPDRDQLVPRSGWVALQARDVAPPDQRPARQLELEAVTRRLGDLYDDCIHGLDGDLGRFLDELREQGRLDNTWVVLTADHGEHLGEHGRFGHVSTLYNELTRVPLVLIPPMGRDSKGDDPHATLRGRRIDAPVSQRDLPATLTGLLDPADRNSFPGRSLACLWGSGTSEAPSPILSQLEEQSMMGDDVRPDHVVTLDALIRDDHILIQSSDHPPELYRRREDPLQLRDLAKDSTGLARQAELRRELDAILRE